MARFYGTVGYTIPTEVSKGVWKDVSTERKYSGDTLTRNFKWQAGNSINDDLSISMRISIVADPFALANLGHIKYIEYLGALWKVTAIEPLRPRLILTIGGIYNG